MLINDVVKGQEHSQRLTSASGQALEPRVIIVLVSREPTRVEPRTERIAATAFAGSQVDAAFATLGRVDTCACMS